MKIIMDSRRFVILALALVGIACFKLPPHTYPGELKKPPVVVPPAAARATLAIIAVDPSGAPIEGARIRIDGVELRANRDGYAAIERERGERRVEIEADGFVSTSLSVRLTANMDQVVTLERVAAAFRGRLQRIDTPDGPRLADASGREFIEPGIGPTVLLSLPDAEMRAWLDAAHAHGFALVRVFAGRIAWRDVQQSPAQALERLPALRAHTRALGMYLALDAVTDSRDAGYDELAHVQAIRAQTAGDEHVVLLSANEPYHPSQSDRVQAMSAWCAEVSRVMAGYPNLWGLGAGPIDYPLNGRYAGTCGPISASHVDRGGAPADILRRALGLWQIARETGRAVLSTEPIGAAEVTDPGRRLADPAFFGELAHVQASMGVVGFFHSEDGLFARPLGPVQREAARAFVDGYRRPRAALSLPASPSCASADGALEIVRCNRSSWARLTRDDIAVFLRDVAHDLNAAGVAGGPFGVLVKQGGNNCGGYSCDVLCAGNGADQDQWDVLGDIEDAQTPGWSKLDRHEIRRDVCEVVRPEYSPFPEASLGTLPAPSAIGMRGSRLP